MTFNATISGHVAPAENVDPAAVEQNIVDKLTAVVAETNDAYPGTVIAGSFAGSVVTANLVTVVVTPPTSDPELVAIAADLRTQATALDAKAAQVTDTPVTDAVLTADATELRAIADSLDPAGASTTPPPVEVPPVDPTVPFVVKQEGEQYSDYLARLTAYNENSGTTSVAVLDLPTWAELPVG